MHTNETYFIVRNNGTKILNKQRNPLETESSNRYTEEKSSLDSSL